MIATSFWGADGKPVSVQEFMDNIFGAMSEFFKNEEELRKIWSNPTTRKAFLVPPQLNITYTTCRLSIARQYQKEEKNTSQTGENSHSSVSEGGYDTRAALKNRKRESTGSQTPPPKAVA